MQIRQASTAISKLADEGLAHQQYVEASSMDLQIRQASTAISKLADEGNK